MGGSWIRLQIVIKSHEDARNFVLALFPARMEILNRRY